jgi:uncharacterized coiled-coil protein SlyX
VLNGFLNEFTAEMTKECKEKGEILKFIWNSMFAMVEHVAEQLARNIKEKEERELKDSIKQHRNYQEMLENYKKKCEELEVKNKLERATIAKLIYELRFKRKEIGKLYKNQKMITNKMNDLKTDNLEIQSSYIDMVSSIRDLPAASVEQMLRAREEINRNKQTKFKVQGNRKANRVQITEDLRNDACTKEDVTELLEEIKEIANNELNSPELVGTLIEAAI